MRWNDIYISAAAASLGRRETTADAVADGRYDPEENEASGYHAVRVSDEGPAVELAVRAANLALQRCGKSGDEFELLAHASIAHQGLDDFAVASYLHRRTVGGKATALEIRQASNGGLAAVELAAAYLATRQGPSSALLTTADRFVPPVFERFRMAGGLLLGDGGTALVLSRDRGVARLLSSVAIGDSTYEGLQIGNEPWSDYPGANGWPVDGQARVEGFVAQHGAEIFPELVQSIWRNETETMERALADAGLGTDDITWWVFPNMGEALTDWDSRKAFGVDVSRTTWDWGRRAGHLGAGDQFAGLAYLLESRKVRAGDRVLLNGAGTGFSFASAVVEIIEEPEWSNSAD